MEATSSDASASVGRMCHRRTKMYVTIGASQIFYRPGDPSIVHLHGGWGYEIYPVATDAVIPDRTGYGRSTPIDELAPRFHEAAAIETERFLDALGITRP